MKAVCRTSTNARTAIVAFTLRCPLGGNRQMVATTASIDLIANKGAQCAHMSIFTNYQVKRCGGPMLLQNRGREQWNRRGAGALMRMRDWDARQRVEQ